MREIKADCTWGDGPDVLLSIDGNFFDLTTKEADDLITQLSLASLNAKELDTICEMHDSAVKDNLLKTIEKMEEGMILDFDCSDEEFELIKNDKEIKELLENPKFKIRYFKDEQQLAMPDSSTIYLVESVEIKKVK